jgi:Ni/Co efflux regulator RcnB
MKRLILTTFALSLLAAPAAFADTRPLIQQELRHDMKHDASRVVVRKTERGDVVVRKTVVRPTWRVGARVPHWQRTMVIRDYHLYGLHRPARGLQWVRIGNEYLLIRATSGVVVNVIVR